MHRHVSLLGALYVIAGALSLLVAVALLVLGVGTAAIEPSDSRVGLAAGILAGSFITLACLTLTGGLVGLWAGAALRRHRPWARLAVLVMALLNLFVVPFGTALGIYSFWVLLHEGSRDLFEPRHDTPHPSVRG